jgi:DNA-binding protein HU-beta
MTKAEMISTLAEKNELTKAQTERVFNSIFDMFKDELAKGNDVAISGFGSFKVSKRAAREGRNPQTNEKIKIPARKAVTFKAGSALKDIVNK